jgi:hypothetical protein
MLHIVWTWNVNYVHQDIYLNFIFLNMIFLTFMLSFCGYVLAVSFILFVLKYFFLFFNINILKKLKKLIFYKNTALPRRKDTGVNRNKSSTKKEI